MKGVYQSRGEVKPGDKIAVAAGREVTLLRHIAHARQQASFTSVQPDPGDAASADAAEAAALVELSADGKTEQFWLRRNDGRLGVRRLQFDGKPREMRFEYELYPLGFSVKLAEFQRETSPDSQNDSCDSQLHLCRPDQESGVISADNPLRPMSSGSPLRYGEYTFSQGGVRRIPGGNLDMSIIRVTSNPGLYAECAGGVLICGGLVLLVYLRFRARRSPAGV